MTVSPENRLVVSSPSYILEKMGEECPPKQMYREFIVNAMHAVAQVVGKDGIKVGAKRIHLLRTTVHGTPKLMIVDNGCGMNEEALRENLKTLFVNNGVAGSRHGVGARIAGLVNNRWGLEYTTWDGGAYAVRATLAWRDEGDDPGWIDVNGTAFQHIVPTKVDLTGEIMKAGHGTKVILLGNHEHEDTFQTAVDAIGEGKKANKALTLYVNERFARIPTSVGVKAHAARVAGSDAYEGRGKDTVGAGNYLDTFCDAFAVKLGRDITVRVWYVNDDVKSLRSGDNVPRCGSVSVSIPSAEVPGLEETYVRLKPAEARVWLRKFGLGPIANRVYVDVLATKARANLARTSVELAPGESLPWADWAEAFSDKMPSALADLCDAAVASQAQRDTNKLRDRFAKITGHLANLLAGVTSPGDGTGAAKPGGVGGRSPASAAAQAPTGTGAEKTPSTKAADGDICGGWGTPADGPGSLPARRARKRGPFPAPTIEWSTPEDCFELEGQAASYDGMNNVLTINGSFAFWQIEADAYLAGRSSVTRAGRSFVDELVRDRVEAVLCEAVVNARSFAPTMEWNTRDEDDLLSPAALTLAAMVAGPSSTVMAQAISNELGAALK